MLCKYTYTVSMKVFLGFHEWWRWFCGARHPCIFREKTFILYLVMCEFREKVNLEKKKEKNDEARIFRID